MLLSLVSLAVAQPLEPCATPWLMPERHLVPARTSPGPAPPAAGKDLRNAYDGIPHVRTSDNFALWWGSRLDLSDDDAEAVLEAFEASWDVQVGVLGHEAPEGSDDWLFNVYVGSTGSGTPSDYGAGGYYWFDSQGWPMVVINTSAATDPRDYGRSVIGHELYHAIQDRTGHYVYSDSYGFTDGSWFWEATANWVVPEIWPEDQWHSVFLFGYLLVPERPLNAFTYPDGSLDGYHQYGAFLWPRYLTEHVVDIDLIAETWKRGSRDGDPLVVLEDLLSDEGEALDALFVVWDYAHGDTYEDVVDAYAPYFPGEDHRVAATVRGDGDSAWEPVDEGLAPGLLGYNLIRFERPEDGDLVIGFDGDGEGEEGTPAEWGLLVVIEDDTGSRQVLLDADDSEWRIEDLEDVDAATLVVAQLSTDTDQDERFHYRWRLEIQEPLLPEDPTDLLPGGDGDDDGDGLAAGCGCATGGPPRLAAPWVLLALAGLRRRRAEGLGSG